MGLFRRLRASSNASSQTKKSESQSPSVSPNNSPTVRQSASAAHLSPNSTFYSTPSNVASSRVSASSSATGGSKRPSRLPWKRDKKTDGSYGDGQKQQPWSYKAFNSSGSTLPPPLPRKQPEPESASFVTRRPAPPPPSDSPLPSPRFPPHPGTPKHDRTASTATAISVDSMHSDVSIDSADWKRPGGVLGSLHFDSQESLGSAVSSSRHRGSESARVPTGSGLAKPNGVTTRDNASSDRLYNSRRQDDMRLKLPPNNKAAGRQGPGQSQAARPPMQKAALSTSQTGPTPPPASEKPTPQEEIEEIRASGDTEEGSHRLGWKGRIHPRPRVTHSRPSEERPQSMPLAEDKPRSSQSKERPPQLRRPSSSFFHNPFQRTSSRASIGGEFDAQPNSDEGSFQLKSFRHVVGAGASTTDAPFEQYKMTASPRSSYMTANGGSHRNSVSDEVKESFTPPRRPPSAAGSIESASRVSAGAFRKGMRRPSSTVLNDDDDDIPLSFSRANLRDNVTRDSSAISLSEPPPLPALSLSPPPEVTAKLAAPEPPAKLPDSKSLGLTTQLPLPRANGSIPSSSGFSKPPLVVNRPTKEPVGRRMAPNGDVPNDLGQHPSRSTSLGLLSPTNTTDSALLSSAPAQTPPSASSPTPTGPSSTSPTPTQQSSRSLVINTRPFTQSPPPPKPIGIPEAPIDLSELKLPPRPDEIPDEPVRFRERTLSPSSPSTTSPLNVFDEPLRRISGYLTGTPVLEVPPVPPGFHNNNDEPDSEEPFDPDIVKASLSLADRDREGSVSFDGNRMSLFERLGRAAGTPPAVSSSTPTTSEPPVMGSLVTKAPVPPPAVPHSSFGRVPRKAAETRANPKGWASSSDEDDGDKKTPPARRPLNAANTRDESDSRFRAPAPMEEIESEDEDIPLTSVRKIGSKSSLRPPVRSASRQASQSSLNLQKRTSQGSLRTNVNAQTSTRPVTATRLSFAESTKPGIPKNPSKWSLTSSPSTISPESDTPSRPLSRINDRQRSNSTDRLRDAGGPTQPGSTRDRLLVADPHRATASPASSQSGLTGDSNGQQPMTPHSMEPASRRSWAADSALRRAEATSERPRPQTHMEQWNGAAPTGPFQQPPVDMAYAAQVAMLKQQMQQEWMAAASRFFDDYWERASSASTVQTMPSFAPTYGYSYGTGAPSAPGFSMPSQYAQSLAGGYPGYAAYPPMGQAAFPPMPPMPQMQGMPGMQPMPAQLPGGSMYSYGLPAQSVFGGEFGPPVASQQAFRPGQGAPGGPPQAPFRSGPGSEAPPSPSTRARRMSSTEAAASIGRPVAHGGLSGSPQAVRKTRPTHVGGPGYDGESRAMSDAGGPRPPSSWRRSGGMDDFDMTPRAKRVTNAS